MQILKTLHLSSDTSPIVFGEIVSNEEKKLMFEMRERVFTKYGHKKAAQDVTEDIDVYDNKENTVYFGAMRDGKLIASLRVILGDEHFNSVFSVVLPTAFSNVGSRHVAEIGRLVVERNDYDDIPRNVLMLFLASLTVDMCRAKSVTHFYVYVTHSLLGKMKLVRVPLCEFSEYACLYPVDGELNGYFYPQDISKRPTPIILEVSSFGNYIDSILGGSLFKKNDGAYWLSTSLYSSFLRMVGVL